jgi:Rrf2 family protein
MDLTLTKRGDYTVRAALALGRAYGEPGFRKIREVAGEMSLPLRYTPQILGLLTRAGLAEARAGRSGGYRLARRPADVSLLDVVEAAEGPLRPERCTLSGGPCHWETMCAVHPTWELAMQALRETLAGVSLIDLLDVDEGLRTGTYRVPEDAHRLVMAKRRRTARTEGASSPPK